MALSSKCQRVVSLMLGGVGIVFGFNQEASAQDRWVRQGAQVRDIPIPPPFNGMPYRGGLDYNGSPTAASYFLPNADPPYRARFSWPEPPAELLPDETGSMRFQATHTDTRYLARVGISTSFCCGDGREVFPNSVEDRTFSVSSLFTRDRTEWILSVWISDGSSFSGTVVDYKYLRRPADCCVAHNGAGCALEKCEECVAPQVSGFPTCGQKWGDACAAAAVSHCAEQCLCTPQAPADCCVGHGGAGCALDLCASCVSKVATGCDTEWTAICAQAAREDCTDECLCQAVAPPDCCEANGEAGCALDQCGACVFDYLGPADGTQCLLAGWNSTCADAAVSHCAEECTCSTPLADCCEAHGGPGCALDGCESCVSSWPDSTCAQEWSLECAQRARSEGCRDACACRSGPPDCCTAHSGSGCVLDRCSECVGHAPECGSDWGESCAETARTECAAECLCLDLPKTDCCTEAPGSPGSTGLWPGCAIRACELCVCSDLALDSCCADQWTGACADRASTPECGVQCECTEPPQEVDCCSGVDALPPGAVAKPGCGVRACELSVCNQMPECCDVWTSTCAELARTTFAEQCQCIPPPVDVGCCTGVESLPPGVNAHPGCDSRACELCVCDEPAQAACCTGEWNRECVQAAGGRCNSVCACDPTPAPQCCVHDLLGRSANGCELRACNLCVCNSRPDCCSGTWDVECAALARGDCADSCECVNPKPDCCAGADPLQPFANGCRLHDCELCLCAQPDWDHCCFGTWDFRCVEQARQTCAADCGCVRFDFLLDPLDSDSLSMRVDGAALFPWVGVVQIGSERIRYAGRSTEGTQSIGSLHIVERGYGSTIAQSHEAGSEVTLVEIGTSEAGDVNCDGTLDADAAVELRALTTSIFGLDVFNLCPSADVNRDSRVGAADLSALLLRYAQVP